MYKFTHDQGLTLSIILKPNKRGLGRRKGKSEDEERTEKGGERRENLTEIKETTWKRYQVFLPFFLEESRYRLLLGAGGVFSYCLPFLDSIPTALHHSWILGSLSVFGKGCVWLVRKVTRVFRGNISSRFSW